MLEEYLVLNIFQVALVFVRIGAALMILPGFSSSYVSPRIRLLLAVAISVAAISILKPSLPAMPKETTVLVRLIVLEVFYGTFLGLIGQVVLSAMHFAGTAIGMSAGIANAMVFDPVTEQQGALVIGFFNIVALAALFVLDLHHVMFRAVIGSYALFPPGASPVIPDHLSVYLETLARAFYVGLQLCSPFLVFGIVFQSMMGLMARLSPQMNVFFVAMPLQILIALGILWVALPSLIFWFLGFLGDTYSQFLPE